MGAAAGPGQQTPANQEQQQHQRQHPTAKGGGGSKQAGAGQGRPGGDPSPPLQPQRSSQSWTAMPLRGSDGAGGGAGTGVPAGAGPQAGPHGVTLASCRSSSTRLSETGHAQVKIEQLNGLLRLGMGHREYLPDMYQMNFRLTSQCGSVCYMSPEVARQLPYNQKADVFSFGCIVFEVMTRQLLSDGIPEADVDAAMEYLSRVSWAGWRPELPPSLPKELRLLISLCWHREPRLRPSFPTIATRLREVLLAAAMPPRLTQSSLVAPPPESQAHQQLKQQQQQQQQQKQLQQQQQFFIEQQQQQQARLLQHVHQLQVPSYWPETSSPYQPMTTQAAHAMMHATDVNAWNGFQTSALLAGGAGAGTANHTGGAAAMAAAAAASSQSQQRQQLIAHRQQLQLQLQLQQLNACTTRLGAAKGAAAGALAPCNAGLNPLYFEPGKGGGDASPYTVHSVGSRLPSLLESTCTTVAYTTATGGRMSSPVLGALGIGGGGAAAPAGRGSLYLEATTAPPGRTTAASLQGPGPHLHSDVGYQASLPSPVSPTGSRGGTRRSSGAGPGLEGRASRGTVSKSEGSAGAASAASLRSPRGQLQLAELSQASSGQEGCMSLCALM